MNDALPNPDAPSAGALPDGAAAAPEAAQSIGALTEAVRRLAESHQSLLEALRPPGRPAVRRSRRPAAPAPPHDVRQVVLDVLKEHDAGRQRRGRAGPLPAVEDGRPARGLPPAHARDRRPRRPGRGRAAGAGSSSARTSRPSARAAPRRPRRATPPTPASARGGRRLLQALAPPADRAGPEGRPARGRGAGRRAARRVVREPATAAPPKAGKAPRVFSRRRISCFLDVHPTEPV